MFPKASAEYEYIMNAFSRKLAFVIGWLIIWSGVFGASTVTLGFAGYFNALFNVPVKTSAIVLIIALFHHFIRYKGVSLVCSSGYPDGGWRSCSHQGFPISGRWTILRCLMG